MTESPPASQPTESDNVQPMEPVDRSSKGKNRNITLKSKKDFICKISDLSGRGRFKNAAKAVGLGHIESSQLSKWYKNRSKILESSDIFTRQQKAVKYRCTRGGRKPILGNLEEVIYNQIMDLRALKIRVTRLKVFKLAIQVAEENNIAGFKSSSKWINGFFRRHRLSLRRQ